MRLSMPFVVVLLLPTLSGCAAVSALSEASRPMEIYELRTPTIRPVAVERGDAELVVEEPRASGAIATERIMIRPGPLRAQYLPGVRWADPAPVMLQTLIVRSLIESGAFGSVGRRPVGMSGDYALLSELTDFQAERTEGGATIRVRMIMRLTSEREARIVAMRTFEATEAAVSSEADAVAAAFDRAAARLVADVVPWLLSTMRSA